MQAFRHCKYLSTCLPELWWRASCRTANMITPHSINRQHKIYSDKGTVAAAENQKPYFQLEKPKYKLNAAFGENMNIMLISNHFIQFVRFHLFLMESTSLSSLPPTQRNIFIEIFPLLLWQFRLPLRLYSCCDLWSYSIPVPLVIKIPFTRSRISRGVRIIAVHKSLGDEKIWRLQIIRGWFARS